MELHAVYASDDNYAPYMGISMFSLLSNNCDCFEKIYIYVLDNGIGKKNYSLLQKQAAIFENVILSIHGISQQIDEIKPKLETGWSNSIFGRYFIDDIVKDGVEKLLYLDCDTIVNRPLNELFDTDVDDYYAAGVIDGLAYSQMEYLGMDSDCLYVNSGMLLINMKKWKNENICKKLVEYVNSFDRRLIYPDQDAFNAVCGKSLLRLPLKYNFFQTMEFDYIDTYIKKDNSPYSYEEVTEAMSDNYAQTVIFHFTGKKPWYKGESSENFEKIFASYAKKSCWKRNKPKYRNISLAIRCCYAKVAISLFAIARKIVGDKFYNAVKQKFKISED